jgi:hypothetical protein
LKTLKTVDSSDRGDAAANEGGAVSDVIVVSEWDADVFHRRVSDMEMQGYITWRENYRVTPEMNPETGWNSDCYYNGASRGMALDSRPAVRWITTTSVANHRLFPTSWLRLN